MSHCIGITLRTATGSFSEACASLSLDWLIYLQQWPTLVPVLLPPHVPTVQKILAQDVCQGFILSNGDDIGAAPARDAAERLILEHAECARLPVLGVCRGLQLLQHVHGGALQRVDAATHAGQVHRIHTEGALGAGCYTVNSFHRWGVTKDTLAPGLACLATAEDGVVEACVRTGYPIYAIGWHPERAGADKTLTDRIIRCVFADVLQ